MKRTRFLLSATKMIPITLAALLNMTVTRGVVAQASFTRIMEGDLAQDTGLSTGCAWGDYDNDGYPDLIVAVGWHGGNRLYHNNGDGTFSRVTEGPIANDPGEAGAVWGDYDNDGALDLFVTNWFQPDCFYRNEGNGVFAKVTEGAWVTDTGQGNGAAWADYDNDGFLDLYVANWRQNNFLYRNNGDGTMTRITGGPPVSSGGDSYGCTWADYDGDGDVDLFVAGVLGDNEQQFLNNGDGSFTRIMTGPFPTSGGNDHGISCADYDNDGDLDVLVIGYSSRLYRNDGAGGLTPVAASGLESAISESGAWGDYDNDGYLDLFISNYDKANFLFHNNGGGTFAQVTEGALVHDGGRSGGCAWADYDNDGDLDLFVANGLDPFDGTRPPEPGFLYRNDGGTNHWLLLRLVGVASNRSAIGAKVRVFATIQGKSFWQLREISGGTGMSQNDLRVHFGLGDAVTVESVRIEWPSGITQFLRDVAVNQLLTVEEEDPTPNNTAPRIPPASPDFNGDGKVDAADLDFLMADWGKNTSLCDIGPFPWGDGVVDEQDLGVLMESPVTPKPKASDVPCDVILSWISPSSAPACDVYFGTSLTLVWGASRVSPLGVLASQGQTATTYDPAGLLEFGKTYYWRVDFAVAGATPTIIKGPVLQFTTAALTYPIKNVTAKASSAQAGSGPEKTVDRSGLDKTDGHSTDVKEMWWTLPTSPHWIQYEFDRVYTLHEMWVWNMNQIIEPFVGFGAKTVKIEYSTDGTTWTPLANVPEFAKASGKPGYTANTIVSFAAVPAQFVKLTVEKNWGVAPQTGLSEVRFFAIQSAAVPKP